MSRTLVEKFAVLSGIMISASSCDSVGNSSSAALSNYLTVSKISSSQVAGSSFSIKVIAGKSAGNASSDYNRTVKLTSSDPAAILPSAHTFSNSDKGTYTFTGIQLKTPGSQTITLSDGTYSVTTDPIAVLSSCAGGKQVFSHTGADQSFTPPPGCGSVTIKMWGAGGGGSWQPNGHDFPSYFEPASGGGGAYVIATLAVDPTQTYTMIVGGGGSAGNCAFCEFGSSNTVDGIVASGGYGGGGNGFDIDEYTNAGGGGRSAIRLDKTELLTAGGGGGASATYASANPDAPTPGGAGGDAKTGGIAGTGAATSAGGGGSLTAGGSAGTGYNNCTGTAGTQFQGGNGSTNSDCTDGHWYNRGGGGGGGGYYGGGGGTTSSNMSTGGGGGGSSYVDGADVSNASAIAGSGSTPGNASDSENNGVGVGGGTSGGSSSNGGNGLIIVYYGALQPWSISPASGSSNGGGTATITGQGFVLGTTVKIGGAPCTHATVVSSTQITCTIPSGSVGSADVVVSGPFAQDATLSGAYNFN